MAIIALVSGVQFLRVNVFIIKWYQLSRAPVMMRLGIIRRGKNVDVSCRDGGEKCPPCDLDLVYDVSKGNTY